MATDAMAEDDHARSARSCLESAEAWRQNARYVRQQAARPHLTPHARVVARPRVRAGTGQRPARSPMPAARPPSG